MMSLVAGCGRSDPGESSVVDPPAPANERTLNSDADTNRSELSGGIELPEGDIPPPDSNDKSGQGGGIEMPDENEQNQPSPNSDAATTKPEILYASWDEIQAQAQATGKVTVVDLWSLSCEPCLKEFPGLVALHQNLGSSVQCIAVDMDYDGRKSRPPERYADRVGAFLASVGAAGFPTYISKTPSDDIFTTMKIASLPAVLVYGADGRVAKTFVDAGDTAGFSYESDISPLVAELTGN
jgi:thiol-disulfide isomerase/thioredoxin